MFNPPSIRTLIGFTEPTAPMAFLRECEAQLTRLRFAEDSSIVPREKESVMAMEPIGFRTDPAGQPAPKPRKLPLVIVKNVQTFRPEDTPDEFLQAIMKELGQQE